jgi:hypothetical protein
MTSLAGLPQDSYGKAIRDMQQLNTLLTTFHNDVNSHFPEESPKSEWRGRKVEIQAKFREIATKADTLMQEIQEAINTSGDTDKIKKLKSEFDLITKQLDNSLADIEQFDASLADIEKMAPDNEKADYLMARRGLNLAKQDFKSTLRSQLPKIDAAFKEGLLVQKTVSQQQGYHSQVIALEKLELILDTNTGEQSWEPPLELDQINQWIDQYDSLFTEDICHHIPKSAVLQFASLLARVKAGLLPQELPSAAARYEALLPNDAKRYLQILAGEQTNEEKVFAVKQLFSEQEEQLCAIACLVNTKKIPLKNILQLGLLNKDELLKLAPYLRAVHLIDLDHDFLEQLLKRCSNIHFLILNNDKITELPPLPNCRTLFCKDSVLLEQLPPLPNCLWLNCSNCPVKQLPELPVCRLLSCEDCPLQSLPDLPNCRYLNCENCPVQHLPALPNCRSLYCLRCPLQHLPALPNCEHLSCQLCPVLQDLPALPNCRSLHCHACPKLQELPEELPLCHTLVCEDCLELRSVPAALPCCRSFNCINCPLLQTMPEVPFTALVSSASGFSKLVVDIDQLIIDPKKFLLSLGNNLLKGQTFPNIYYFSNGELSPAIDVGGVRRDFVTRLFELLFFKGIKDKSVLPVSRDGDAGVWPIANANAEADDSESKTIEACYQTIGRLFALCYLDACNFKAGEVFDPRLFAVLRIIANPIFKPDEALMRSLLVAKGLPETIAQLAKGQKPPESFDREALKNATYLLNPGEFPNEPADFSKPEIQEALLKELGDEAKKDERLLATSYIAAEMKKSLGNELWESFCQEKGEVLQKKIQGELSADALKKKLRWATHSNADQYDLDNQVVPVTQEEIKNVRTFLENWIDKRKEDRKQLSHFVRAVTSNNTLGGPDLTIKVYHPTKMHEFRIPQAHTCFFTLDIPSNYPNQEVFDEKLDKLLTEGLAGTAFQEA